MACRLTAAACATVLCVALGACAPAEPPAAAAPDPVERGRYLVNFGGCNDCHTPKVFSAEGPALDTTRLLAGHPAGAAVPELPRAGFGPGQWAAVTNEHFTAWGGAWGISYAANLTPHQTGLQSWTDSLFIVTMRTGRHLGAGRPILPPMPWQQLASLTDDDLRAIAAYLRSLPPIDNAVPAPVPSRQ